MAQPNEIEKLEKRSKENPLGLTFAPYAEALRKAGQLAEALKVVNGGIELHPNYVAAHIVQGRCNLDIQDDAAAEASFQQVLGLDPENVIALKSHADIFERSGRLQEAIQRLELLLDVDRSNDEAKEQLGRIRGTLAAMAGTRTVEPSASLLTHAETEAVHASTFAPDIELLDEPATSVVSGSEANAAVAAEPTPSETAESKSGASVEENDSAMGLQVFEPIELTPAGQNEYQLPDASDQFLLSPNVGRGQLAPSSASVDSANDGQEPSAIQLSEEPVSVSTPPIEGSVTSVMVPDAPNTSASVEPVVGLIPEVSYDEADTLVAPVEVSDTRFGTYGPPEDASVLPIDVSHRSHWMAPAVEGSPSGEPGASAEEVANPVEEIASLPDIVRVVEVPMPIAEAPSEPALDAPPEPTQSGAERGFQETSGEVAHEVSHFIQEPPHEPVHETPHNEVASPETLHEVTPVEPAIAQSFAAAGATEESADDAVPEPATSREIEAEPELVVTETMAELFYRQGHKELSLAVYTQLAERAPQDERLADAVEKLRTELKPTTGPSPVKGRFDAQVTGGEAVGAFFRGLVAAHRPAPPAAVLRPAFEAPIAGAPTRAAEGALSLNSVFGDEPVPIGPASTPDPSPVAAGLDPEAAPSFDEFFGGGAGMPGELPSPGSESMRSSSPETSNGEGEDLSQFNDWLKGLKR